MIYNASNGNELGKLHFHDYQLKDIVIDYTNKISKVYLLDPSNTIHEMIFRFCFFSIECLEPWGEGIYINSFTTSLEQTESGEELINIEILLNSGDTLVFKAREIVF